MGLAAVAFAVATPAAYADGGWTRPSALTGPESVNAPQIAANASGAAAMIWVQTTSMQPTLQVATRPVGGPWQGPVQLASSNIFLNDPQITISDAGAITAVWTEGAGTGDQVRAITRPAGTTTWESAVTLSFPGRIAAQPQVVVDSTGATTAIWHALVNGDYMIETAARPAGGSWTPSVSLSPTGQNHQYPQLAVDGAGALTAIWTRTDAGASAALVSRRPAGGSWIAPFPISGGTSAVSGAQIAVNRAGFATATWLQSDSTHNLVRVSVQPAGGSFSSPVAVSPSSDDALTPQVAVNDDGNATVVWSQEQGFDTQIMAASFAPPTGWSMTEPLSELSDRAITPQVTSDSQRTIAIWAPDPTVARGIKATVRPRNGAWQAPTQISTTNRPTYEPSIQADGAGNVLAGWSGLELSSSRIYTATFDVERPVISGVSLPAVIVAGKAAQLTVGATDAWAGVASATWAFGDGGTGSGASASHTYLKAGHYTATATATDAVGNASSASRQITVVPLAASGKTVTIGATLSKRKKAKRCPKARQVTVKLSAKGPLAVKKRALKITTTPSGCLLSGTLQLKKSIKPGRTVTAKIRGAATKPATVSATAS